MRATQRSLLVLLFVFICNMALVAPTLRAAPKEKKIVNKKAGCLIPGLPGVGELSIRTLSFPTLSSPLRSSREATRVMPERMACPPETCRRRGHPPSVRKKHGAEWGKSFRKSWYARGDSNTRPSDS